jgi:Bacterial toxin 46
MAGIDFNHPVDVISLSESDVVVQHFVPGCPVGNYFAPVGTAASEPGINPAGRVPNFFSPTMEVPVLRSTAAPIVDTWTVPEAPFSATSSGTQYFTETPGHFQRIP